MGSIYRKAKRRADQTYIRDNVMGFVAGAAQGVTNQYVEAQQQAALGQMLNLPQHQSKHLNPALMGKMLLNRQVDKLRMDAWNKQWKVRDAAHLRDRAMGIHDEKDMVRFKQGIEDQFRQDGWEREDQVRQEDREWAMEDQKRKLTDSWFDFVRRSEYVPQHMRGQMARAEQLDNLNIESKSLENQAARVEIMRHLEGTGATDALSPDAAAAFARIRDQREEPGDMELVLQSVPRNQVDDVMKIVERYGSGEVTPKMEYDAYSQVIDETQRQISALGKNQHGAYRDPALYDALSAKLRYYQNKRFERLGLPPYQEPDAETGGDDGDFDKGFDMIFSRALNTMLEQATR